MLLDRVHGDADQGHGEEMARHHRHQRVNERRPRVVAGRKARINGC